MSHLNYQKCSMPQLASVWIRLRLARFFLWLTRVTDSYGGPLMKIADRLTSSVERTIERLQ